MRVWVLAILIAAFLAGCAEEAATAPEEDFDVGEELVVTEETGAIRGVVVDDAVLPIEGVKVVLNTGAETASNSNGAFGFGDLEPGTYFMDLTAPGYLAVQSSVEVVAAVADPPIHRVRLSADGSFIDPFSEGFTYNGFYQCGTSVIVICAAPNIFFGQGTTDDSSTPTFYWDTVPNMVQSEMVWKTTQTLSPALYFEMEALDSACSGSGFLDNAEGESPIWTRVNRTVLDESTIGGDCGIYYSIFAGGAVGPVGFSLEQKFTWYITSFYGYELEADDDWMFVNDGDHQGP